MTRADVIAGNLAGLSVTGFRRQVASVSGFDRTLELLAAGDAAGLAGPSALLEPAVTVDLRPGSLRATGGQLDLALEGPGYFCIQTPDGEAYTRAGGFQIDPSRRLVTTEGNLVLGESGPLRITGSSVQVTVSGEVVADGAQVGRLKIVELPAQAQVEKLGKGLLRLVSGAARPSASARVQQGYLEEANVNAVGELVAMISSLRAFEASQRALQATDQTLDRAIHEVGRA